MRPRVLAAAIATMANVAFAADPIQTPHDVIEKLHNRMDAIGQTTGLFEQFVEAENQAAKQIRRYLDGGGRKTDLVAPNSAGQTPLMAAAFMGYSRVVEALLEFDNVRQSVDDKNSRGLSSWIYANIAFGQSMWVCNPTVFKDPFEWVPMVVIQPYYAFSPENPYKKTRRLLEAAGAKPNVPSAKRVWMDNCKLQDEVTRKKVEATDDLLETLLTEGSGALLSFLAERQWQMQRR